MKRGMRLSAWLSGLLVCLLPAWSSAMPTSTQVPPPHVMTLRHVGEEDAALPRIEFSTAAAPAQPVPRVLTVPVKARTYQALCKAVAAAPVVTSPSWRTGSFSLQATGCLTNQPPPSQIEPETFLRLLDLIRAQGNLPCATMDSINRIANIIRQSNRLN